MLGKVWRTLRHVPLEMLGARAVHVARRLLHRLTPGLVRNRLARAATTAPSLDLSAFTAFFSPPRAGVGLPRHLDLEKRILIASGKETALSPVPDWTGAELSAHGRYKLHSFEYLEELVAQHSPRLPHSSESKGGDKGWAFARQLIANWIDNCPAPQSPAWDAFPLSLRCVNWLKLLAQFPDELGTDQDFARRVTQSLYAQTHHLSRNLEYQLRLNHLMENARALIFLGAAFRDPAGDHWLRTGRKIIDRAVHEQFFADGCHVERSPMYHAIVLELMCDCVDVVNALGRVAPSSWRDCIERAAGFLESIVHPDGALPLVNDSTEDGCRAPGEIIRRTAPHASGLWEGTPHPQPLSPQGRGERMLRAQHLPPLPRGERGGVRGTAARRRPGTSDSGFLVVSTDRLHLIVDAAAPSPPYNPGHAHAGALSYELSVKGTRLVVDTGGGIYGTGPDRDHVRSTRAHNTVSVDGADQSEVWGAFRVGGRSTVRIFSQKTADDATRVSASCVHADRTVTHVREWIVEGDRLRVCDRVHGSTGAEIEQRIVLVPGCEIERESEDTWRITSGATTATLRILAPWSAAVEECTVAHRFGRTTPAVCVVLTARGAAVVGEYQISWESP